MEKYDIGIIIILWMIMLFTSIGIIVVASLIGLASVPPEIIKERVTHNYDYSIYPVEVNEIQQTQIHINNTVRVINQTKIVRVINVTENKIVNPQKIDTEIIKYVNQILNKDVK